MSLFLKHNKCISVLYDLSRLKWHRSLESLLMKYKILFIMHNQYYGCWWRGDAMSQCISRYGIDLVVRQYSNFGTCLPHTECDRWLRTRPCFRLFSWISEETSVTSALLVWASTNIILVPVIHTFTLCPGAQNLYYDIPITTEPDKWKCHVNYACCFPDTV